MSTSNPAGAARMPVVLLGGGGVGRMHGERLLRHADCLLAGVADPSEAARLWAEARGVPWAADAAEMLDRVRPGAAIVATPNAMHTEIGLLCVQRKVPAIIEKPVAHTVVSAQVLAEAARAASLPMLVGHQRRHNAMVQRAREVIRSGALGRIVSVALLANWFKPSPYFEMAWRRQKGGGPVLINAIHDIDLLRFLVGEITEVHAFASNAERGFEVEDNAAAVLRLAGGALATLTVTDCAVSPWNYDLASGESELYAQQPVDAIFIAGSEGALALPQGQRWHYRGTKSWHAELTREQQPLHHRDPFVEQIRHLRAVAEGREAPLCSLEDGIATLRATEAVLASAASGASVRLATTTRG
jgi:predicted dehydrogenase